MTPHLPADLEVRQMGALDSLDHEQILCLAPHPDDYVLHTRLRDGSSVTIGREYIMPLVQGCIAQLEEGGANPILLLCTGDFPELKSNGLLVEPDRLLLSVVWGLGVRRLGVMVPLSSQVGEMAERWEQIDVGVTWAAASPYAEQDEVTSAAAELTGHWLDLIVMDCMGFTQAHKEIVSRATGRPVMLASCMVARVVGELLDSG
jgi:protein AroM